MIHKVMALLLGCMLLLGSCSILKESETVEAPLEPALSERLGYLEYYASLYRVNETTGRIMETTAELRIQDWRKSPEMVVEALLASQIDVGFGHIGSKVNVQDITISGQIANVSLRSNIHLSDRQRHYLAVLVSNTVIENCGVTYVDVNIDGKSASIVEMPLGLYGKSEGDLAETYAQYREVIEALEQTPYHVNAALYFIEPETEYILPEVRSIDVNVQEPVQLIMQVLWELAKGPQYEIDYEAPLRESAFSQMLALYTPEELTKYLTYEDGVLTIQYAEQLFNCSVLREAESYMACAYYTLKGILPELKQLHCYWNQYFTLIDEQIALRYLGDDVNIYLPNEDMCSIQRVERVVHTDEALDWNTYLRLIGEGPVERDPSTVISVFPGGLSEQDFISLELSGDCAVLNFSQNFIRSMERLTTQGQMLMIYSIVNTVCNIEPIQTVQFLVDGQPVSMLKGSNLSLASPLMANPGLVKQS